MKTGSPRTILRRIYVAPMFCQPQVIARMRARTPIIMKTGEFAAGIEMPKPNVAFMSATAGESDMSETPKRVGERTEVFDSVIGPCR